MTKKELKYIGKPIAPVDGVDKVTGRLKYAVDYKMYNMAYGKILRSEVPHAEIIDIDTSAAEAMDGVLDVLTHKDVPQKEWHGCWFNYIGISLDGHPRFYLDDIGVVIAETQEIAERAAELVKVTYKELPAVFTLEDAVKLGAPKVKPAYDSTGGENMRESHIDEWGEVEKGQGESDYITEVNCRYAAQQHANIGRNAAIGEWTEGNKVTVYTGTQTPSELCDAIAAACDVPVSHARVVGLPSGSSMGLFWSNNFMILAALASRKVGGRPVKIELTQEECYAAVKRRHMEHTIGKMGCDKEGNLVFIEAQHDFDLGGYCWKDEVGCFGVDMWGARAKHGKLNIRPINTNLVTAGCMRGVGDCTLTPAIERMADTLAAKVGLDPVEFRIKNQIRPGDEFRYWPTKDMFGGKLRNYDKLLPSDIPDDWPKFMHLLSSDTIGALEKGSKAFNWKKRWKGWGVPTKVEGTKKYGIGVGTGVHTNGFELEGGVKAIVRVNKDGSAVAHFAAGRMGNNAETTLMQIMAEELGLPIEVCTVRVGDTETAPWAHGSLASNTAFRTGWALRQAAKDAKGQILEIASYQFFDNTPVDELTIEDGIVKDKKGKGFTVPKILNHLRTDQLSDAKCIVGRTFGKMPPSAHFGRQFAAQFAEVCVDTETGEIQLTDYLAVQNSGVVLNSLVMKNQVFGGVMAGAGFALKEEMIFDYEKGKLLNPGLTDYKVLRIADFPAAHCDVLFVEDECPVGPFGARGVSESPIAAAVPTVNQAVFNAIGVWVDFPMTPERVLKALGKI